MGGSIAFQILRSLPAFVKKTRAGSDVGSSVLQLSGAAGESLFPAMLHVCLCHQQQRLHDSDQLHIRIELLSDGYSKCFSLWSYWNHNNQILCTHLHINQWQCLRGGVRLHILLRHRPVQHQRSQQHQVQLFRHCPGGGNPCDGHRQLPSLI
ncbi:uncharacterized protein [Aquarana catesbeiana]|uniref:uncharacterized protein isoform X1 n=1 Tax=Aquarana catesbeiana TaxID=8400 RepID=UPI003CC9D141